MYKIIKLLIDFESRIDWETNKIVSCKTWSESWKADRLHDIYTILHRMADKVYMKYEACMKEAEREEGE